MIKITLSEYNALPKYCRGVWSIERDDLPNWAEIRDQHMGKRTMLHNDNGTTVVSSRTTNGCRPSPNGNRARPAFSAPPSDPMPMPG